MLFIKQNRVRTLIYALLGVCLGLPATLATAQSKAQPRPTVTHSEQFHRFLHLLRAQSCIQDVPAPTLFAEPRFTQGTSNKICFQLPDSETLPFPADTVRNPFVITLLDDGSGTAALEFPRPVDLHDDTIQIESIMSLQNGVRYSYSTALFLPVCKVDCEAVSDSTQLELHCSAYRDTVWSIQDTQAPEVLNVRIPQLLNSPVAGWANQSSIRVEALIQDQAGVWQGFLHRRNCSQADWGISVSDTTYPSNLDQSGYVFEATSGFSVTQDLADGCYEFRIEGRDATHTPESCFPNFELAGNGGVPAAGADPHIRINIDTAPPSGVTLSCEQVLNTIELSWNGSADPAPGIGLAGYRIFRDGVILDSVPATATSYVDTFPPNTPTSEFVYQVQPYDSLDNVQTEGGSTSCGFTVVSQVVMSPEPEFTSGTTNEVCWTGSPNIASYTVFVAKDCEYENADQFSLTDTCFTFVDLEDGTNYCYWVRAVDQQQRVVWSDTVQSRQDATTPEVTTLEVLQKKVVNSRNWTTTRDIEVRIVASDGSPGVIQELELFENGVLRHSNDLEDRSDNLDVTFSYALNSSECEETALSVRVLDAAGNQSVLASLQITLDETPPEPVTTLSCAQLSGRNGIGLDWSASKDPGLCSGLAGYQILRDGSEIARVSASAVEYEDILPAKTPSGRFTYEVHPFDSVGNFQSAGTPQSCDYVGISSAALEPLPEFTSGLSQEICVEITGSLTSLTIFVDENCDSSADDSVSVVNPGAQVCQTFRNLGDGRQYCYWAVGLDEQQRTVLSDTVQSAQDDTAPVVDLLVLPDADTLNGELWAYGSDVRLQLIAHDSPPGQVWTYEIVENGQATDVISLPQFSSQVNEILSYSWTTPIGDVAKIDLAVRVFDGANNASELRSLNVNVQEALPRMFAFPNPFNPVQANVTIRLDDPEETEVRIYDFFGNLVRVLSQKANSRDFVWDGKNGMGETVASGGYVCVGTKTKSRFKIGVVKRAF